MHFFNLSLLEFLGLLGVTSTAVVALYLLNRSRRKQVVATLRFWRLAEQPILAKRRKRIQQPWSLVLQLLSILCLLLAVAQLRLGSPDSTSRDHVLILDTSSWMAAKNGKGTLLDEAKVLARRYYRTLPSTDRVMLVRADGLASPATALDTNRDALEQALAESRPGAAALNLPQALQFASQVQKLHAIRGGEIVFIGAGRISREDASHVSVPNTLRVLPVSASPENCGLRRLGLRRSISEPEVWEVFVSARNYGNSVRTIPLALAFGGAVVAGSRVTLAPNQDVQTTLRFRTKAAGWLEARLMIEDGLSEDNRVFVELPPLRPLRVAVFTNEPELIRPVMEANRYVQASYHETSQFASMQWAKGDEPKIYVLDRFVPAKMPTAGAILLEPPSRESPFSVRLTSQDVPIVRWHTEHPLGAGLRTKEIKLANVQVFSPRQGDIAVADVASGPVILARPGEKRLVALGFHPGRSDLRFDLATPLLFANLLRWMEPGVFRHWEANASSAGPVATTLEPDVDVKTVRVLAENGAELPNTISGRLLRFYSGMPGTVRVISDQREQVFSLTLPEVGEVVWTPPSSVRKGLPRPGVAQYAKDLWPWLAVLGALGLMLEWKLFGRARTTLVRRETTPEDQTLRRAS